MVRTTSSMSSYFHPWTSVKRTLYTLFPDNNQEDLKEGFGLVDVSAFRRYTGIKSSKVENLLAAGSQQPKT